MMPAFDRPASALSGPRIGDVERVESTVIASSVATALSRSERHSGFHASIGFCDMNVAKPSFSQMSFHHFIVTRSPNH